MKNRLVIPAMASGTADQHGFVTDQTLAHYKRLSEAQPGLLFVEYTYVHASGRSEEQQPGAQSDSQIEGLTRLARLIQSTGARAGLQLTHAGGKTERHLSSGQLMGPSGIIVPVKDRVLEKPSVMTNEDIELWKTAFASAARRAALAGFDVVELHAAHGYGLNQWLSRITNKREDAYGGHLQGRMKLLLEIIALIRAQNPTLLISVRMPGADFFEGGLTTDDSIAIAQQLERADVDILNISSGIGGWRRPRDRNGEGYLVPEAARIQAQTRLPVIGVGGIESTAYIDENLERGHFALAAVGRAILKDPRAWALDANHLREVNAVVSSRPDTGVNAEA